MGYELSEVYLRGTTYGTHHGYECSCMSHRMRYSMLLCGASHGGTPYVVRTTDWVQITHGLWHEALHGVPHA